MNHLYLKGLAMYIDEQLVTGTYIVDFYANKKLFKKIRLQADGGGVISFYDENDNITVVAQYGSYVSANNLYRYIQIDIDSCPDRLKKFLNYPDNITDCDNGYFETINNIDYFIDMKDSSDTSIQSKFNTSTTIDKYKPLITPVSPNYFNNNIKIDFEYDYFYISFDDEWGNTYYLNTVKSGDFYTFSLDETLNYNSIYFMDSDHGGCLKVWDLKNNVQKYLISKFINNDYYITLADTIGNNFEAFIYNNKIAISPSIGVYYCFTGASSSALLYTSTNSSEQVNIVKEYTISSNLKQSLHYKDTDNTYLGINFPVQTININGIADNSNNIITSTGYTISILPYTKLPEIMDIGSNVFSGNWLVDGYVKIGLTYVLPNTINYTPLYYKKMTIKNNTNISGIKLFISKPNNGFTGWEINEYFTGVNSSSQLNTNNTIKEFISQKYNSIQNWSDYYFRIIPSSSSESDKACYFSTSPAIQSGTANSIVDTLDIWCKEFELEELNYNLEYSKFSGSNQSYETDSWQAASSTANSVKAPSYVYSSSVTSAFFTISPRSGSIPSKIIFNNGIYLNNLFIAEMQIGAADFSTSINQISNGMNIPLTNVTFTPQSKYKIWGCPQLIKY